MRGKYKQDSFEEEEIPHEAEVTKPPNGYRELGTVQSSLEEEVVCIDHLNPSQTFLFSSFFPFLPQSKHVLVISRHYTKH